VKTLIISLLRLGDLVMISGIIRKFAEQGKKIDLLVHREVRQLIPLLVGVQKVYEFDRELVQYSVGEQEVPLKLGPQHLTNLLNSLNKENYDIIYNLTNTHLSAYFMSQIQSFNKVGLNYKFGKFETSEQDALLRFNGLKENSLNQSSHFVDIFSSVCALSSQAPFLQMPSFKSEMSEKVHSKNTICIQPLTSDEKKNWGFENWKKLVTELGLKNENIKILCSQKEYPEVLKQFQDLLSNQIQIKVLSLSEVLFVLSNSKLLVTGDTAIKHMASAVECSTVEIALGSSKVFETGIYLKNSIVITSNEKCYPCRHSEKCHYKTPICRNSVSPKMVLDAIGIIINSKNINPKNFFLDRTFSVQTKGQFKLNKLNKLDIHQGGKFEKTI
jgi:ADP-heptose:LPS heptosyltransferase